MFSVELVPAAYGDVVFIARRMRALDAEEILPLIQTGKPEDLAAGMVAAGGIATVALSDGVPVAAYGAYLGRPQIWTVWMFATDRWPEVALSVTRDIRRSMMPAMLDGDAVRADCWSMEGHDMAHRWLEVLGAVREATVEDYGPTRKSFHCYSWTRSRLERDGGFDYVYRTIRPKSASCSPSPTAPDRAPGAGRSRIERRGHREKKAAVGEKRQEIDHSDRLSG
jgi:hypothetical protein